MEIEDVKEHELKRYVTEIMISIEIPAHLKGYRYIRQAIILAIKDQDILNYMTKGLYVDIAKENKDTPQCVERAIRRAIEKAWENGNIEIQEKLFGYSVNSYKGKPTNSEFIARIADKIQLDIQSQTAEEYITEIEKIRQKKIAELKRQIAKLENMKIS